MSTLSERLTQQLPHFSKVARQYAYDTEQDGASDPTWLDLYEAKLAECMIQFISENADGNQA